MKGSTAALLVGAVVVAGTAYYLREARRNKKVQTSEVPDNLIHFPPREQPRSTA